MIVTKYSFLKWQSFFSLLHKYVFPYNEYRSIGVAMVSVDASSAIDRGFEPRSCKIKDYTIVNCCFSAKHATLRKKSKDWLDRNQNNVFRVERHVYR